MLHQRLVAIVLLGTLFGANTGMASVCEACCARAGEKNTHHQHQTATRFSSPHHHTHAQEHRADCPQCPKSVRRSALQPPDCGNFSLVQALQENSRVCDVSQADGSQSSTGFLPPPIENERFSTFHSPPKVSSFEPILVSLRI